MSHSVHLLGEGDRWKIAGISTALEERIPCLLVYAFYAFTRERVRGMIRAVGYVDEGTEGGMKKKT